MPLGPAAEFCSLVRLENIEQDIWTVVLKDLHPFFSRLFDVASGALVIAFVDRFVAARQVEDLVVLLLQFHAANIGSSILLIQIIVHPKEARRNASEHIREHLLLSIFAKKTNCCTP